MKFSQAIRAMERGEVVRRKPWPVGAAIRQVGGKFEARESGSPEWFVASLVDGSESFSDWVIVRKKKKTPPPLRDVFKDPRVGDVVKFNGTTLPAETVRYFDSNCVLTHDGIRAWAWQRQLGGEGSLWLAEKFTIVSRAPQTIKSRKSLKSRNESAILGARCGVILCLSAVDSAGPSIPVLAALRVLGLSGNRARVARATRTTRVAVATRTTGRGRGT